MMPRYEDGIPYTCPLIDDVIRLLKEIDKIGCEEISSSEIASAISTMETIRKHNSALRGKAKDNYDELVSHQDNSRELEQQVRNLENENENLEDSVRDLEKTVAKLESELEQLQEG
jgi:predicted RNase H-like nuclease (RuvC/YqgF family)